jgi:hypothetical protein
MSIVLYTFAFNSVIRSSDCISGFFNSRIKAAGKLTTLAAFLFL